MIDSLNREAHLPVTRNHIDSFLRDLFPGRHNWDSGRIQIDKRTRCLSCRFCKRHLRFGRIQRIRQTALLLLRLLPQFLLSAVSSYI